MVIQTGGFVALCAEQPGRKIPDDLSKDMLEGGRRFHFVGAVALSVLSVHIFCPLGEDVPTVVQGPKHVPPLVVLPSPLVKSLRGLEQFLQLVVNF